MERGLYRNLKVVDVVSLYPSVAILHNISFDTVNCACCIDREDAKGYSGETRRALLNLCSYAYDAEVRLGARMVLDFISARIAVSSNDLRRMVPFRRRNEGKNVKQFPALPPPPTGFMNISLRDGDGADPCLAALCTSCGQYSSLPDGRWYEPALALGYSF